MGTDDATDWRRVVRCDLLPAAVVLLVVVLGTWATSTLRGLQPVGPVGWALVVLACALLVLRLRHPLATLSAVGGVVVLHLALGHGYGPVLLGVGVAAYAAARWEPLRRALPVAVLVAVAIGLTQWWAGAAPALSDTTLEAYAGFVPAAAWVSVPFSAGYAVRVTAQGAERARQHAVDEQVAAERLRLSQDVHDVVGHGLTAIKMQADVALHVAPSAGPEAASAALRAISGSAGAALTELREVLGGLEPTRSDVGTRAADLEALRARMTDAGLDLHWDVATDPATLPPAVARAGYRVLQEGLTNVLRHGSVDAPVQVESRCRDAELLLRVCNRVDRPARSAGGSGLAGMRQRVEALGGRVLAAQDGPEHVLDVRLPLDPSPGRR